MVQGVSSVALPPELVLERLDVNGKEYWPRRSGSVLSGSNRDWELLSA